MPRTNLSLGNLFRATTGADRTSQAVSLNARNASAGTSVSMLAFAIDSVTPNLPAYTYVVESTNESAGFTFGTAGALHGTRVGSVAANYSVTFNNANFSVGSPTLGASPSFPITPAAINASNYSEASSTLSMTYADGYNTAATGYNSTSTKTLFAVDVYNTINEPDFCLVFGTKIELANGNMVNIEDLNVGDEIKAWVPAGLPDESQDLESDQIDWRFYHSDTISGSAQTVTITDLTFNFAEGYFSLNDGLIKATETHPLYVWDNEIEKYKFKNVGDILIGDRIIKYTDENGEEEIEVVNIEIVNLVSEIVTINVESADVYISNGFISHNKIGLTNAQPSIPASGLRMYLDPTKTASFGAGSLPATGTPSVDWLDLSGYGTGVRPAAQSPFNIAGANPPYNNGASRSERYYTIESGDYFAKDRSSNISGGITQFDTTALTYVTWIRATAFTNGTAFGLLQKIGADVDYRFTLSTDASITQLNFTTSRGSGNNSKVITPSANVWYQVALTVSAAAGSNLYIDTTNLGNNALSAFSATSSYNVFVGNNGQTGTYQQGPALFYNRVLTATEIAQVYNHFQPTYRP
jgi:hypothetical protein